MRSQRKGHLPSISAANAKRIGSQAGLQSVAITGLLQMQSARKQSRRASLQPRWKSSDVGTVHCTALLRSPELSAAFSAIHGRTSARIETRVPNRTEQPLSARLSNGSAARLSGIRASQIGRASQMRWEQHTAALDIKCAIDRASSDGISLGAGFSDEKCVPVRDHRNRLLDVCAVEVAGGWALTPGRSACTDQGTGRRC